MSTVLAASVWCHASAATADADADAWDDTDADADAWADDDVWADSRNADARNADARNADEDVWADGDAGARNIRCQERFRFGSLSWVPCNRSNCRCRHIRIQRAPFAQNCLARGQV